MTTYDKNSQFEVENRGSLKSIGFPPNYNKAMNLKCKNCGQPWKEHSVHTEKHPSGLCPWIEKGARKWMKSQITYVTSVVAR